MAAPVSSPNGARQVLTFLLADQTYGIEILHVQEIKAAAPTTAIPNTPPFIKGVMNLRGTILSVVDLRLRFGLPPARPGRNAVIIVATVGRRMVGLLVDAVSDVIDLGADAIQAPPDFGAAVEERLIRGVACVGDAVVTLLDLPSLLAGAAAALPTAGESQSAQSAA
jgi:purine-binding chemotaxis protein CheW